MRTTKVLLALVVVALLAVPTMAQEGKKKKGKGVKISSAAQAMLQMEKVSGALKTLDLTEEQEEKLGKLHQAMAPKMKTAMDKIVELVGKEKMEAVKEVAEKARAAGKQGRQIAIAVEAALKLTDEQKKKMDVVGTELKKVQREMLKKINGMLTDEQKTKLKAAMAPKRKKGGKKKKSDK